MEIDRSVAGALRKIGIEGFTKAQEVAIPEILSGKDVLLIAPSGSGKTEAAVIPLLQRIFLERPKQVSCLYITPLRALNRDMLKRLKFLAGELGLKAAVRHGDTPVNERSKHVKSPPDIMITTPETLQILLIAKKMKEHLRNVRWVVVDEVHELAGDERGEQLAVGLERLQDICASRFQRIGLSATVGSPDEVARFLGGAGEDREVEILKVPIPKGMDIRVVCPTVSERDRKMADAMEIDQSVAASLRVSKELIEAHASSLLFVNTRNAAEFLGSRFLAIDEGFRIGVHHGSLSKDVRIQMEEEFKAQVLKALICTSSLELGIDIGSVDLVLQYNSPRQAARLVQRVGRSGHSVDATSKGVVLAYEPDEIAEACAITERALGGELEGIVVREGNLAVLANQLVGMAMAGPLTLEHAFATLRRSHPFRNLRKEELAEVAGFLAGIRLLRFADGRISRSMGSIEYFFDNISMIADQKSYKVRDITTRRIIGTLDERFVETLVAEETSFVMRGLSWRLVEVGEDHVLVEPQKRLGSIPSWMGEEIPVPYEVARLVGEFRRTGQLGGHCDDACLSMFGEYLGKQEKAGFPIPGDDRITIEGGPHELVLNACLGTKVNETLGHLISSFLTARMGESVRAIIDPYRIVLETPAAVEPRRVEEILRTTSPDALPEMLRVVVRNSSYFRSQLMRAAKKFGVIEKGADLRALNLSRLVETFEDTPLGREAVNRTIWEVMDAPKTAEVLRLIQSGRIGLVITGLSPIGTAFAERLGELLHPRKPDAVTLEALKKRLENETVSLFCLHCKTRRRLTVKDVPEKVKCQNCGGVLVAAMPLRKAERKDDDEKKERARLFKNADLVMAYGKRAVLALVARGVGEDVAARMLRMEHDEETEFLREVLRAEVSYARTRRFWD